VSSAENSPFAYSSAKTENRTALIRWGFERMKKMGILASGCKITETPDLTTSVSLGAALFGSLSKKYGKPYIRPIVPEDMSILTEGNVIEPLVYAGEKLPFTKTFDKHFLLSSTGQREIVVPIYIGHDADSRRLAETLTIEIQRPLPQSHPVEVELEIGTDKDSVWRFRPKGGEWTPARLIGNCWIGREATEEINKLLETRSSIRVLIEKEQRPPARMLAEEALQAARAGFPEEGLALIEDLLHANPKDYTAWNIKALIHGQRGEFELVLESFGKASSLEPNVMVFRGNYGTALVRTKRYQEAVVVMREALSRDPTLTYLHSWLAEAFQALQNVEELNKELEMCFVHARRETIRSPEDVSAWEGLRAAALRIGRYEEAEEAIEAIHELRRLRNLLAGAKHG
jgi:tetratricopeptide (TPR) repeat protein